MNKALLKVTTTVVFVGFGLSAVDVGAVNGTITGQIINAKTGEMVCALVLINGEYKTYSCVGDDNKGAPFTLPYDYATNSSNQSANKLHLFAENYAPTMQQITQANQNVRVEMTRIEDLTSTQKDMKMCSFIIGTERHSVPVPSSWERRNCEYYAKTVVGAWVYNLSCFFSDGAIRIGPADGGPPLDRNCGW